VSDSPHGPQDPPDCRHATWPFEREQASPADPAYSEPAYTEPIHTEPICTEPAYTEPAPQPWEPQPWEGQQWAPSPPPARVPGWLWPLVAALALVVGLFGGLLAAGTIAVVQAQRDEGQVSGGLDSVDTESEAPLPAANGSVAAVAEQLLPSTVQIVAEYGGEAEGATGSGFVLDRQGHVVTNNHVIAQAAADDGPIKIIDREGNAFTATLVGRSPVYDLAVLYAKPVRKLQPVSLGASATLRVGEGVVAIGSPLGLTSTVTAGIVSSLNRPVTTGETADDLSYIDAVQTDAAINPGNSGGPLVNLRGQVVGVNSAIATSGGGGTGNIGVGFAIPVEQVKITADQILRTGEARYPVVGATVQRATTTDGAVLEEVLPDSPAAEAGLEAGDRIIQVGDQRVTDGIGLIVAIRTHRPGDEVTFVVVRDGEQFEVSAVLDSKVG